MVNRSIRLAFAAVLGLTALAFLLSLAFPPDEEPRPPSPAGESMDGAQVDPATTSASREPEEDLGSELEVEPTESVTREEIPAPSSSSLLVLEVRAQDSERLRGAIAQLTPIGEPPHRLKVEAQTDAEGRCELKVLTPGRYRLLVGHPDFFAAPPQELEFPTEEPQELLFELERGAFFLGRLEDKDGNPVRHGVLRLLHPESGAVTYLEPDGDGRFDSGPLLGGLWHANWLAHRHADVRVENIWQLTVAPGERQDLPPFLVLLDQ